ncbi:GTP-binding protein [Candidatus Woesearchaeota archaeon]|nr:GTP-binding protein [Candidatus Woesearchaeota archaeon]
MTVYEERIREIEEEIKKTQYNKATEHHIGMLKAKISQLRKKHELSSKKSAGEGFAVKKSGDATVCLVGFPSVGKSTILNRITNAESRTAAYAFTTLTCIPGIMDYRSAKIQVLDVPGLIKGASLGAGKGKEVIAVVRNSDLVVIVADIFNLKQIDTLKEELYNANIRLDEEKPSVTVKQATRGGLHVATVKLTKTTIETVKAILKEYKINSGNVLIREDITAERLIDVLEGNRTYISSLTVLNKMDLLTKEQADDAVRKTNGLPVSAESSRNMQELKEAIYQKLRLVRIYLKEHGKKADSEPLIIRSNPTVEDICRKLHRDFVNRFKYAKVWGPSAKYPGERFLLDHTLKDGDTIEIKLR